MVPGPTEPPATPRARVHGRPHERRDHAAGLGQAELGQQGPTDCVTIAAENSVAVAIASA